MSAKLYRNAVNVLKPSKARMAAIHAKEREIYSVAKMVAASRVLDSGQTAKECYKRACEERHEFESELTTAIRVILLGMARKEGF